jgi:hypothetical protein
MVALDVEDCVFGKDGLTVTLRRSKADQDGTGRKIGIPYGSSQACLSRSRQVRGPFAVCWPRNGSRVCWGIGAVDHEPDRT